MTNEIGCIFAASGLINNLSDLILWTVTSMPIGDFLKEAIMINFELVMDSCFPVQSQA